MAITAIISPCLLAWRRPYAIRRCRFRHCRHAASIRYASPLVIFADYFTTLLDYYAIYAAADAIAAAFATLLPMLLKVTVAFDFLLPPPPFRFFLRLIFAVFFPLLSFMLADVTVPLC